MSDGGIVSGGLNGNWQPAATHTDLREYNSQLGWIFLTCPWSSVNGDGETYLAVKAPSVYASGLQKLAENINVNISVRFENEKEAIFSISGKADIQKFYEYRAAGQERLARLIANAPWDDILPVDGSSGDIILSTSKGIETGAVLTSLQENGKEQLFRALGMLGVSYVIDSSVGNEAVFIPNPDHVAHLSTIRQTYGQGQQGITLKPVGYQH